MSVAVVCVEVGDYCGRGDRYVRSLKAMVKRHLTVPHSFYCITDEPKDDIVCIASPTVIPNGFTLNGWWNKIFSFKDGLFDEDLIIYFDLDTFILQNIDGLAEYKGSFAMLKDFWAPVAASGVMMWKNGAFPIWEEYERQGMPQTHINGDGGWFGDNFHADLLQELYPPGYFVSYKTDCLIVPPKRAHVVCFHGTPRPHEAKGWPRDVWNRMKPAETLQMLPVHG